ncbi:MAG TPA: DUF4956 domain-containing protein [Gemmatimonadaceae bacterium]|nr:DUF4956 domain-containing protein [Gemmatimonadaceae bacterium]
MPVLASIIDVFTRGSDRPVRRLVAYYLFLGLLAFGVALLFPRLIEMLAGKGVEALPAGEKALTDGLTGGGITASFFGPGTLGDVAISTLVILVGTLLLMLPVSWVYMSARSVQGHSQSVTQTLIILPLVVAGIIIVVQNSLALAFSLAGVVGAVRFRTNLKDTRDLVFVFLSIAVGFAAGVQSLAVGAIVSMFFNFVIILTWRYDYGRNVLTPTASSQWAGPLQALASETGQHEVPDRDLILSLTPEDADALAERFERVRGQLGKNKKKPRYDSVLTISTDEVSKAQEAVKKVLDEAARRYQLDEVIMNTGKPSVMHYLVKLKKSMTRDQFLTDIQSEAGGLITSADLEVAERIQEEDTSKV